MPLEFESLSHGKIAFGFFNIETDMILLNHYFLFADNFCHSISKIAGTQLREIYQSSGDIFPIEHNANIGNLMGAIHGIDHSGFIGEIYKIFPFPKLRVYFKQNPEGFKTQSMIEELIQKYAKKTSIPFVVNQKEGYIAIGEYFFNKTSFQELIKYIWVGGAPRWKDEIRPTYVLAMKEKIEPSKNPLFNGLDLL